MTAENAVEVLDLTKHFGDIVAVDRITFKIKRGELFGFLGPNAAGKTTTIRMLTGILKPDQGSASVLGHDIGKDALAAKQLMGIVPEIANVYVDLSAWKNLMLIGELYGVSSKERKDRACSLLKEFGLYERRNDLAKGFSKGMRQKLLLCMALINSPHILFLDEPTSGLDVESQRLIRDMIRELNRSGITVFLTTHNMEEANRLCDRIAIIDRGRIGAIDSPEKLRLRSTRLHSIEISFDKQVTPEEFLSFRGVKQVEKVGDKIRLLVDESSPVLEDLVDFARSAKLKMLSLNTLAPSLEDVFLELIKES